MLALDCYALSRGEAARLAASKDWHDALLAKYSEFGFCYEPEDIPLTPIILPAAFLSEMGSRLRRLMALARTLAIAEHGDRAPIRQDHRAIVDLYREAMRLPIMGRPDCILARGALKVLELNIEGGMGGIQEVHELIKGYRSSGLDALRAVTFTSPFEAQIEFLRTLLRQVERKSVAVVPLSDFNRFYLDQSDHLAAEITRQLGVTAKTVFPEALRRGEWLTDGQNEYGIFYRDACHLHEPIVLQGMEQALRNARSTKTLVLSDPVDIGVDDKGALALISEYLDGPTGADPELADLGPLVPWTRLLDRSTTTAEGREVDLAGYARANRHRLVLKRCMSHVGKQVYVGSHTEEIIWDDILARTKLARPGGEDWVVQEFIPSYKFPFWFINEEGGLVFRPSGGTIGPFLFGEAETGWLVRVEGHRSANNAVLALPTDGNMGITTVAAADKPEQEAAG